MVERGGSNERERESAWKTNTTMSYIREPAHTCFSLCSCADHSVIPATTAAPAAMTLAECEAAAADADDCWLVVVHVEAPARRMLPLVNDLFWFLEAATTRRRAAAAPAADELLPRLVAVERTRRVGIIIMLSMINMVGVMGVWSKIQIVVMTFVLARRIINARNDDLHPLHPFPMELSGVFFILISVFNAVYFLKRFSVIQCGRWADQNLSLDFECSCRRKARGGINNQLKFARKQKKKSGSKPATNKRSHDLSARPVEKAQVTDSLSF
jgi:hypothetical protein